ncbi:acylphosphatase [Metabacillus sp. 84]|uniref:acylphosphatase n=1 Tax=unclassified Metabacillus TaxID=2675274 RepID=UPI003CF611D4
MKTKLLVHGHVQGVGFRYYAQTKAIQRNIKGWAKNMDNGSVEIVAAGENQQVEAFIGEMEKGSPLAKVEEIEQIEYETEEAFSAFDIKY